DEDTRLKALESDEVKESEVKENDDKNYVLRIRKLLRDYKTDLELWNFLTQYSDTLSKIADLTIYRRSVEVGIEPTAVTTSKDQEAYALGVKNEEAYSLLKSGEIRTFNKKLFGILDLSGVDLRGANLSGVDLRGANLRGANLSGVDLRDANLSKANLIRGVRA